MLTDIIKRALFHTVTDIGQLSANERKELNKAVRLKWLAKGKGGGFPALKTVYAYPAYDFAGERKKAIKYSMWLAALDKANREKTT